MDVAVWMSGDQPSNSAADPFSRGALETPRGRLRTVPNITRVDVRLTPGLPRPAGSAAYASMLQVQHGLPGGERPGSVQLNVWVSGCTRLLVARCAGGPGGPAAFMMTSEAATGATTLPSQRECGGCASGWQPAETLDNADCCVCCSAGRPAVSSGPCGHGGPAAAHVAQHVPSRPAGAAVGPPIHDGVGDVLRCAAILPCPLPCPWVGGRCVLAPGSACTLC